jgi:hypothetical protein
MVGRILILLVAAAVAASAQPPQRRATNLAALLAHPAFYHLRPVVVAGQVTVHPTGETRVSDESGSIRIAFSGSAPEGLVEIRGEFWDIGRMNADDPRLAAYDLRAAFDVDPEASWPRPGQALAIIAGAMTPASPPPSPSVRAMVLFPTRYLDQKVTVTGQFAGRNLLGDLPDAPARSRYDFVLRSADAAIWVSNIEPRGRDFRLALDARIDTGRWLEVTGTLQQGRGLQWLDAEAGTLKLTEPQHEPAVQETTIQMPAAPPPEVIFSAPTEGETEVALSTNIRIQFSRDIDAATVTDRVRAGYTDGDAADVAATSEYHPASRMLEIRFAEPLEPFRALRVELMEGVVGTDRQSLVPWTLTFTTGAP